MTNCTICNTYAVCLHCVLSSQLSLEKQTGSQLHNSLIGTVIVDGQQVLGNRSRLI